jgi:hypothetical protein
MNIALSKPIGQGSLSSLKLSGETGVLLLPGQFLGIASALLSRSLLSIATMPPTVTTQLSHLKQPDDRVRPLICPHCWIVLVRQACELA